MSKRKPRPAKAGRTLVEINPDGEIVIVWAPADTSFKAELLTPAQAKRIGRKLLELAEYVEEKGAP